MPREPAADVRCASCGKNFHPEDVDPAGVCHECTYVPPAPTGARHLHPDDVADMVRDEVARQLGRTSDPF
jgi:hypothetical protein